MSYFVCRHVMWPLTNIKELTTCEHGVEQFSLPLDQYFPNWGLLVDGKTKQIIMQKYTYLNTRKKERKKNSHKDETLH